MGNIVLLDDLTINKIAAGEVIERPASVIKEMVENSIDAGATHVTIEIKNGGISFIRITDNGKGIAKDDVELAFERHATSKIRTADDLDTVKSMGFRGEALASIAAIANVELVSKTEEEHIGNRIVVEGGDILSLDEIGCSKGTTITVRNLFFNTPVRYKFLKKDFTESGYIEDVVTRIALVHPEIAIKFINSGKIVLQTNGNGNLTDVIYSIFGKEVASNVINVDYEYEYMKIKGVIGKPTIARSNRSNQIFFVNKRYIKDKMLTAATEQAYKGLIPIGKYGFVVLNINMNPSKVDVNVHPAKLEVRFEEENKIFQSIYHAIKNTLLKSELVADTEKSSERSEQVKNEPSKGLFDFRKNETKKIEQYNDEESKIKTNVGQVEHGENFSNINIGQGGPVNTADILEQLKKMKENLQKQIENKPKIDVEVQENEQKNESEQLNQEDEKENKVADENNNNKIEDNKIENIEDSEKKLEEEKQNIEGILPVETKQNVEETVVTETKPEEKLEEIKEQIKKLENINYEETTPQDFNTMYEKLFGRKPIENEQLPEEQPKENKNTAVDLIKDNISVFEQREEYKKPIYKFIGIAFNTYIIIEMDKEMYIIDQHAAHERIMYEKVKKNYYSEYSKDSQMLLLPDVITLTHKEMEIAKDNMDLFKNAGFSLEEFGENTIKLTGVPTVCLDIDNKELFLETLDEINTIARTAKQEKEERFIATVACKAAVKANMVLDKAEVENLMDKLLELPNPFTCPHGRPTAIKMSKYDIERKFARK